MSQVEIVHEEREEGYARPLFRAALRDSRLSWGARGLFAFLWDLPSGWSPRLSHLIKMAPEGRDAVRSRLQELRAVGAMRLEVIRGDAGRVTGTRWVIISPRRWAVEASLESDATEERIFRNSVPPSIEKATAKVLQVEGSPIHKTTTSHDEVDAPNGAGGGGEIDPDYLTELVEAGVAAAGRINSPVAFKRAIRLRIWRQGPNADDLAALAEFRRRRDVAITQAAQVEADRRRDEAAATPEAQAISLSVMEAELAKSKKLLERKHGSNTEEYARRDRPHV